MRASGGKLFGKKLGKKLSEIFRRNKGDVGFFTSPCSHGSLKKSRTVVFPSKGGAFKKAHDHFISVKITDAHRNVPKNLTFPQKQTTQIKIYQKDFPSQRKTSLSRGQRPQERGILKGGEDAPKIQPSISNYYRFPAEFSSPLPLKRRFFGSSKCLHLRAEA